MFFSPELLSRRDSGFGLLWLAATLGSKSTFKKLPKKSVLTANIAQLCDLIAEPEEPLALRLSSNLMVGVARVYKVKQEIFMADVTTCFNSLKKVVQELQSTTIIDAQLQMAQPSVKSSALTLTADSRTAFILDFDNLVADWDEYLNINDNTHAEVDDLYDPFDQKSMQPKQKGKAKAPPLTEHLRADLYTLKEHHDHILSASFDLSFNGSGAGVDPSSSQLDGGFGFDDNFFGASDVFDAGGELGDELARELGDGWGGSPIKDPQAMDVDLPLDLGLDDVGLGDVGLGLDMDMDLGLHDDPHFMAGGPTVDIPLENTEADGRHKALQSKRKTVSGSDKENLPPPNFQGSVPTPNSALSPATSFSRLLLSQDFEVPQPLIDITANQQNQDNHGPKKVKRTRLLLDARTELTDDELKTARAQYLQGQNILRREIGLKKTEKDSGKIIEDIVWGVPRGIHAQVLVEFWQENFKVQVEARSGALCVHPPDEPPSKRRKIKKILPIDEFDNVDATNAEAEIFDNHLDMDMGGDGFYNEADMDLDPGWLRSSEDPGQGRRVSRPPSIFGSNLGLGLGAEDPLAGSQRSSLFPWDNAGPSSSVSGVAFGHFGGGSDRISVDHADVRMRGSSLSRRSSPLPGQMGNSVGGPGLSPAVAGKSSQPFGEDYAFDLDGPNNSANLESQQSDMNLITLERNSLNFLEYTRMQYQTLPNPAFDLTFDVIVPKATSTRHVAAAAFYHCLVLATKDFLRLKQQEAYSPVVIVIA